jgi:hypothetical protein
MEQAREARAEEFASVDWKSAEQLRTQAEEQLARSRRREGNDLLLKAKVRFDKARRIALEKQESLRAEIRSLRETGELRCKAIDRWIDTSRGRLTPARRRELEKACARIHERIAEISERLEQGDFAAAKLAAQTNLREVWESEKLLAKYLGKSAT